MKYSGKEQNNRDGGKKKPYASAKPKKEDLRKDLLKLGIKGCGDKYHIGYKRLVRIVEEYGLSYTKRDEQRPPESRTPAPKRRRNQLEAYLSNEDDLTLERQSGFLRENQNEEE